MYNDVLPKQLKYGIGQNDEMVLYDEYQTDEIFSFLFFTHGNLIICKIVLLLFLFLRYISVLFESCWLLVIG